MPHSGVINHINSNRQSKLAKFDDDDSGQQKQNLKQTNKRTNTLIHIWFLIFNDIIIASKFEITITKQLNQQTQRRTYTHTHAGTDVYTSQLYRYRLSIAAYANSIKANETQFEKVTYKIFPN